MKTKIIPSFQSILCQVMSDVLFAKGNKEMMNIMFETGRDLMPVIRMEEILGHPVMTISAVGKSGLIGGGDNVVNHTPNARRVDGKLGRAGGDALWQFLNRILRISVNEIIGQFCSGKGPYITNDELFYARSMLSGGFTLFTMKRAKVPYIRSFYLLFHTPRGKSNIMRNRDTDTVIAAMCGQISSNGNQHKSGTNVDEFVNAELANTVVNMYRHTRAEIDFNQFICCTDSTSTTVNFPDAQPAKGHMEDMMENFLDKPLTEQIPKGAAIVAAGQPEASEVVDIKMSTEVQPAEMIGIPQPAASTPVGDFSEADQKFGSWEPASEPRWTQPEDGAVYEHIIDIVGTRFVNDAKMYNQITEWSDTPDLSVNITQVLEAETDAIVARWSEILQVSQDNAVEFLKKYCGK